MCLCSQQLRANRTNSTWNMSWHFKHLFADAPRSSETFIGFAFALCSLPFLWTKARMSYVVGDCTDESWSWRSKKDAAFVVCLKCSLVLLFGSQPLTLSMPLNCQGIHYNWHFNFSFTVSGFLRASTSIPKAFCGYLWRRRLVTSKWQFPKTQKQSEIA